MSTTTGDGVARAFLKAQASLFGSYRSALKIEPEEPITFCEETFVSHRSSAMRPFLQNAIQLQLFKQFIDGRLDLLNTGNGFSDVFEEEINMGEYAGSDKLYHQWLSTVKKGSGALINTMKTRANPAMKNVYKFAKDHAKMGIKEVKNRLKQKDLTENGCSVSPGEPLPRMSPSLSTEKDPKSREDRRPITVHFGQVRPPRPNVARRPKSNAAVEGRRTSVSSPDQPQQYRTLKESDPDGDETISPEKESDVEMAQEATSTELTHISLLEDIFSNLEPQPLGQAKSLEDLRTPKEDHEDLFTFDYQRMDFTAPERSRMVPTMKHSHPYNKLWSMGHDDMAIPTKYLQFSPEKDLTFPDTDIPVPHRERVLASADRETPTSCSQSSITIPRPHGRKTPELGIVPPPPAPRGTKQHPPDPTKAQPGENSNFTAHVIPGPFGDPSPEDSYKHAPDASSTDMLQPVKVSTEVGVKEDILSLLDPLKTGQWQSDRLPSAGSPLPAPEKPLGTSTPCFTTLQSEYVPAAFPQPLAFSSPRAPFMHSHLNPFVQAMPAELPAAGAPGGPFSPQTGSALLSTTGYYQSHRPHPSALPGSNLFGQVPSASPLNPLLQQARSTSQTRRNFPPTISGPAGHRTLPMAPPSSKPQDSKSKAFPPIPPRPSKISDPVLLPSKPGQPKDPFDDLINKTRQEVAPAPGKVEQLRKRWETFE